MPTPYPPDRYNDDLILRVPPALWVVMFFLVRHVILLGITFLPTMGEEVLMLRSLVRPWYLPADLLALPVLIAAARRRPEAGTILRLAWSRGAALLTLSALAFPILALARLVASGRPLSTGLDAPLLVAILGSLGVIAYLRRSPLARDAFRDFPPRPGSNTAAQGGTSD